VGAPSSARAATPGVSIVRNERKDMQLKATFQIQGNPGLEKVIKGNNNQEIWNSIISEVSTLFPECDESKIELEKQQPNPIFLAKNEQGDVLCKIVCDPT
jgi:hypothetical protein